MEHNVNIYLLTNAELFTVGKCKFKWKYDQGEKGLLLLCKLCDVHLENVEKYHYLDFIHMEMLDKQ